MSAGAPPQPLRSGRFAPRATDGMLLVLLVCAGLFVRILRASSSGLWRDGCLFLFVVDSPTVASLLAFLRLEMVIVPETLAPSFNLDFRPRQRPDRLSPRAPCGGAVQFDHFLER